MQGAKFDPSLAALAKYPCPAQRAWSQRLAPLRAGFTARGGDGSRFNRRRQTRHALVCTIVQEMVVDTSGVLAVLLNEPSRAAVIRATEDRDLLGAASLPLEVGNALMAGFRRARLTGSAVSAAWLGYQQVKIRLPEIDVASALEIAMDLGLYAYDAYVLETARSERSPLITLDNGLARAARKLGLKLVEVEP